MRATAGRSEEPRRPWRAAILAGCVALPACQPVGGAPTASPSEEIVIAIDLPLSGTEAALSLPALNGARFAVSQANQQGAVEGFRLTLQPFDDAADGVHDPRQGAVNVRTMVGNPRLLGILGPIHFNVAVAEIPIANEAHLPMVSPVVSNTCLTRALASCGGLPRQLRPTRLPNYFALAATDDLQGKVMAGYAYERLALRAVAVASDGNDFGKELADSFTAAYTARGGRILLRRDFEAPAPLDARPFVDQAKRAGAQAVYFGGTDSRGSCGLRASMKAAGFSPEVALLGGSGLHSARCLQDAGDNAAGISITLPSANSQEMPRGPAAIQAFKKVFHVPGDYSPETMPMVDATNLLIAAVQRAVRANHGRLPTREQVRAEVARTSMEGVTGPIAFDQNGERVVKTLAIYRSEGSPTDWQFVQHVTNAGS